ncbi:helix-turn-helix domain-containing protein [uncultured Enterococcus sp.]|uniref:helix-turn-helix domain-containing protein n=1 Tax=uncultured Enterococcus sp. TaxID=167972 RepID=UPI00259A7982|nr:helix-turn-helix domain-containing protein [uncultured Enterococcus sp.]
MPTTQKDYFEELFDRETFLQRRMILLLNEKNGYWVTREWLSDALGLSKRTTLGIMNSLAEKIADLHSDKFSLQLSKGKGVRLTVAIDADVYNLVTKIVQECPTVVLLKTLILDEFQSVRHYALAHFTSESTVRRDLAKVRRMLSRYKVKISRDTFQLEGEEYQIRMIMVIFSGVFIVEAVGPFPLSMSNCLRDMLKKSWIVNLPFIPIFLMPIKSSWLIFLQKRSFVLVRVIFSKCLQN